MEKLKVPNPTASDLGDQLGIPLERRQYLSKEMDRMASEAIVGGLRIVTIPIMLSEIQTFCISQEEFIWCTCNHIVWLWKTGRILDK